MRARSITPAPTRYPKEKDINPRTPHIEAGGGGETDVQTYNWTEFLLILQNFVPYQAIKDAGS